MKNNQNLFGDFKTAEDVLAYASSNTEYCSRFFFPDIFYSSTNVLLRQILDALDSEHNKIVIAAPRGVGKTTSVLGYLARSIIFALHKFILYISNSSTVAEIQTDNLKTSLISSKLITNLLGGSLKASSISTGMDERFSRSSWYTSTGVLVMPRGARQQVRGLVYGGARPDLILYDDLESKELLRSPLQRQALREWFFADPMKCESKYRRTVKHIYIDTLKHEDSLLQHLLEDPDWYHVFLSAFDENLNPTAPEYMSKEEIEKEYRAHERANVLEVFYMEYGNSPVTGKNAQFKSEYFRYFEDYGDFIAEWGTNEDSNEIHSNVIKLNLQGPHKGPNDERKLTQTKTIKCSNLISVTMIDPAKTDNMRSAESAVITVSWDPDTDNRYVREPFNGKIDPDELYTEICLQIKKYNSVAVAVEVTSLHKFITIPLKNYLISQGIYVQILEINAIEHKIDRIRELAPYYIAGKIFHEARKCMALESQLCAFPRGKYVDLADCLAQMIKVEDELELLDLVIMNSDKDDETFKPINQVRYF